MRNLCCKCPHYYNERSWEGDCDWVPDSKGGESNFRELTEDR